MLKTDYSTKQKIKICSAIKTKRKFYLRSTFILSLKDFFCVLMKNVLYLYCICIVFV
jgi:hypothetical protein